MALGPFYVADKLRSGNGPRGIALFMRHGETAWNRIGKVMGQLPIELDEAGRAQVALALPAARLIKPDLIVVGADQGDAVGIENANHSATLGMVRRLRPNLRRCASAANELSPSRMPARPTVRRRA